MARDIVIDVVTKSDSRGLQDTATGLDKVATEAEHADKNMGHMAGQSGELEKEIRKAEQALKNLSEEFDRTGNRTLFAEMRKQDRLLTDLKRFEKYGQDAGTVFSGGFASVMSSVKDLPFKGILIGSLVAAGVAAAPALGAAIGSAVIGTVGLGGIAGGIISAAHDPKVVNAAHTFGKEISAQFFQNNSPFVEPIERSLAELSRDFGQLHLADAFATAAPYVEDVTVGIGEFAKSVMPGFNSAMKAAGPVLHEFSQDLPVVGHALSDMFDQIGKGKGNVEGMRALMGAIAVTLEAVGHTVSWLSDRWHDMVSLMVQSSDALTRIPLVGQAFQFWADSARGLQDPADKTVKKFQEIRYAAESTVNPNLMAAQSIAGVAKEYRGLQDIVSVGDMSFNQGIQSITGNMTDLNAAIKEGEKRFEDFVNAALGIENVNIAIARGMREINDLVKTNGRSLDINTKSGDNNLEVITKQIGEYEKLREQTAAQTGDLGAANKQYATQIQHLKDALIQEGFNKKKVDDLVNSLSQIPKTITTTLDVEATVHVTNPNLLAALGGGGKASLAIQHSGLPGGKDLPPRAAGGHVNAGQPYWVGEYGPEPFVPSTSGTILPAGFGGGQQTVRVVLDVTGGQDSFASWVRDWIRGEGGNVQTVLGPPR